MKNFNFGLLTILFFTQSGCSLFFGNIKPAEEKSTAYGILELSKTNAEWIKLDTKSGVDTAETKDFHDSGVSDMAFQSKKTAAIISINSACRSLNNSEKIQSLLELTRELLLGISDVTFKEDKSLTLDNTPALQTTLRGKINNEEMMLRTVVLQRARCVYDLMYITRPKHFQTNESEFSRFVSSLRLK